MVHENDWIQFDTIENVVVVDQENLIVEEQIVDYYQIIVVVVDENFLDYHVLMNVNLYIDLSHLIVMLVETLYLTIPKKKYSNINREKQFF